MNESGKIEISGVNLSLLSADEILERVTKAIAADEQIMIASGNVHSFNIAAQEGWFRDFLNNADVVRLDGFGLRLGAAILGYKTPERSTWADFGWDLARHCEEKKHSIFFFGAKPGVAEKAAERLKEKHAGLGIAGIRHGHIDLDPESADSIDVINEINKSGADILLVGLGMPSQELWLLANRARLNVKAVFTGGAVFDYLSGEAKRAPKWMLDHGFEWLYRFRCEPGRMWRRYLLGNPVFLARVFVQRIRRIGLRKLLYMFLILLCFFLLYGIQGNRQETHFRTKSAILWMVDRWSGSGGDLSHGWIIPLISLFIVWRIRDKLSDAAKKTSYAGLTVIILSLFLHWFGMRAQLTRISLLSMIGLIWGIPFYFYGPRVARLLLFPCAYLVFCIPLSFLNNITVPLRVFASKASVLLLNGFGIESARSGTMVYSAAAGGFNLDIADPCSGLRSLIAMAALSAVYSYFTQRTLLKQWILFIVALPVAIAGNIARIVTIAITAELFGQAAAMNVYHNYSGMIVIFFAMLLLVAFGKILDVDFGGKLKEWKSRSENTSS